MRPRWQKIEKENPWLQTQYYDYDENRAEVEKFGLEKNKLPTFIFYDDAGTEFARLSGEPSIKDILKIIEPYKPL